jgi:glycosyltransferase involved in cell wall biosynthesis
MKSVVMIAYFFPPEGSAGVYRPLRFLRHLSKMGWSTTVVSADPYGCERYDPELLELVPTDTEVVRVRGKDMWQAVQAWRGRRIQDKISAVSPDAADKIRASQYSSLRSSIRKTVRTAEAYYYHPDLAKRWIRPAVKATVEVCARKRPDVIWATAAPISAWVVARQVADRTAVPYVLDLRDPLGLSYYDPEVPQPPAVKRRIRRTMHQLFEGAQSVVFLFDSVAETYCRLFAGALDARKVHIIPNGYEGTISEFAPNTGNQFTVLYTGTVTSYRYDTLLQALASFKKADPTRAAMLRFRFVGEGMDDLAREASMLGLSDIVVTSGPTSHAEITRLEREADAFLVLGRLSSIKGHELFAGAKVFNYLKANRPVLGVLPQDETRKILERVGVSTIADAASPVDIKLTVRRLLDAWSEETLTFFRPIRAECEVYSAERQTEALVQALKGLSPAEPFAPGMVDIAPSLRDELQVTMGKFDPAPPRVPSRVTVRTVARSESGSNK